MKKHIAVCGTLLIAVFCSDKTHAVGDQGLYFGLSLGVTDTKMDNFTAQNIDNLHLFSAISDTSNHRNGNSQSWQFSLGYRINRDWSAEGYYTDLGKYTKETTGTGLLVKEPEPFALKGNLGLWGYGFDVVGDLPLNDAFSLFAEPGILRWAEAQHTILYLGNGSSSNATDERGVSPLIELGARYRLSRLFSVKAGWERYFNVGKKGAVGQSDVDVFALDIDIGFSH